MSGLAETETEQSAGALWLRRLLGVAVALAAAGGLATIVSGLGKGNTGPVRQMARITIVPDTPPPPPPPPREERKVEPPKLEEKQVQVEQPKQEEAPPQPAETLKMEGAGSESGLAGVQAGTVNEEYRGQTIGGDKSTGGGGTYHWYGSVVQRELQQILQKNRKLSGTDYRINLRLWISPQGEIARVELAGSSGNRETDELLRSALAELPPLKDRPPADMPQPIRLRVTSRT